MGFDSKFDRIYFFIFNIIFLSTLFICIVFVPELVFVFDCNWPYLSVLIPMNKLTKLN